MVGPSVYDTDVVITALLCSLSQIPWVMWPFAEVQVLRVVGHLCNELPAMPPMDLHQVSLDTN